MSKSTSDKTLTRRSPRTGPSAAILAAKQNMKSKMKKGKEVDFVKDDYEVAQNAKSLVKGPTAIVYDETMRKHYCLWDTNYPECPERFSSVLQRCKELNLLDRCQKLVPREATEEELLLQHTPESVRLLKESQNQRDEKLLEKFSSCYDSIYVNNDTYKCSLLAAGCAIDLVDAICTGKAQNGMAIIRPPGHHAMKDEFCGYCFFNNVAIAARHALDKCKVEKILIVDWDVHHGQGTQQMFYEDPRVVYFSIHRYEHGSFWPELRESDFDYIGAEDGKGYNFNVPLNKTGMKDADYLAIFHQVLLPMAYEFQPSLILVSAGYDAAIGCPEGEMEVTPACYAHLLSPLMGLAQGKVAVILEGGYCLKSLAEGAALTLRTLLGDPVPNLTDFGTPCDSIVETILNVIYTHKPYWNCYQLQKLISETVDITMKFRQKTVVPPPPIVKKHIPRISYTGNEVKPTTFETRNCYPVQDPEFISESVRRLEELERVTNLKVPPHRVALAYDNKMTNHENCSEKNHPEKPERIKKIYLMHKEYGLKERCLMIAPRLATEQEILLVHTRPHLENIKLTETAPLEELKLKENNFDSIYLHPDSYRCALMAAGSVLRLVDLVVSGTARSGVAIVRPPGHHAEDDTACGFCFFNNVSIAAKYAIEVHSLERILLLDWDVHHGNGTQKMFESDPRVLYISLHRYNQAKFFPSSTKANFDQVGIGEGVGFNVNIPWNKLGGGLTDGDYISAFFSVVMPIAYQFNPELVLVSSGFDACIHDPLGNCKVSPEAFAHMTHWLTSLANGKVILTLEGGYNVTSISYAMTLCTKALLGDPLPLLTGTNVPCPSAMDSIRNVIQAQEPYWASLKFNYAFPKENVLKKSQKIVGDNQFIGKEDEEKLHIKGKQGIEDTDSLVEKMQSMKFEENLKGDTDTLDKPEDGNPRDNAHSRERRTSRESGATGNTERPTAQTLVGYLSDNMQRLLNREMFAVVPLPGCPHLVQVQAVPQTGIDVNTPCSTCESDMENWICLICYSVFCGRYINQHMMVHNEESTHPLTLSFTDLSVWCYVCEAYIDNMILYPAKNAVHRSKFGSDLQWSYGENN